MWGRHYEWQKQALLSCRGPLVPHINPIISIAVELWEEILPLQKRKDLVKRGKSLRDVVKHILTVSLYSLSLPNLCLFFYFSRSLMLRGVSPFLISQLLLLDSNDMDIFKWWFSWEEYPSNHMLFPFKFQRRSDLKKKIKKNFAYYELKYFPFLRSHLTSLFELNTSHLHLCSLTVSQRVSYLLFSYKEF